MKPEAPPAAALKSSILLLGLANLLDMALQAALPIVLVRVLAHTDFGIYRGLWLVATTAVGILPLAFPTSLPYFLPRAPDARTRAAYLMQCGWTMLAVGLVGGAAAWLWSGSLGLGTDSRLVIAGFIALWVFASLLDTLFSAQQRVPLQAWINIGFSLARFVSIAAVAVATHSLALVLAAHVALAGVKALACAVAVAASAAGAAGGAGEGGGAWRGPRRALWLDQFRYALPIGLSSGLYLIRSRLDQWIVAALFTPARFGTYSIAAIFLPVQGIVRLSVNNVVLPELSRLGSQDGIDRMLALNRKGNVAIATLMFPTLAFLFACASELLALLFTAGHAAAAPVLRLYCLTLLIESMEVTMLLYALRQGAFLVRCDLLALAATAAVGGGAVFAFGPSGAALGAAAGTLLAQVALYRRVAALAARPLAAIAPWRLLARLLASAALGGGAAALWLAQAPPTLPAAGRLALAGAALGAVYWLALRAFMVGPALAEVFGPRLVRRAGLGAG